jgi:methylated-DNA-[protein]-cysteine S-methyltransferase
MTSYIDNYATCTIIFIHTILDAMNQQTSFRDKVLDIVRLIPKGKTMTYAEVAELAGSSGAYRAVGSIMKSNFDPSIPCLLVISSDGNLGEYNRGKDKKVALLREEGAI